MIAEQPRRKFKIRSREHLRSVLLTGRDAYLRRGQTTRHSCVMNFIQSLVSNLKANMMNPTHEDLAIKAGFSRDGLCIDSLEVAAKLSE